MMTAKMAVITDKPIEAIATVQSSAQKHNHPFKTILLELLKKTHLVYANISYLRKRMSTNLNICVSNSIWTWIYFDFCCYLEKRLKFFVEIFFFFFFWKLVWWNNFKNRESNSGSFCWFDAHFRGRKFLLDRKSKRQKYFCQKWCFIKPWNKEFKLFINWIFSFWLILKMIFQVKLGIGITFQLIYFRLLLQRQSKHVEVSSLEFIAIGGECVSVLRNSQKDFCIFWHHLTSDVGTIFEKYFKFWFRLRCKQSII